MQDPIPAEPRLSLVPIAYTLPAIPRLSLVQENYPQSLVDKRVGEGILSGAAEPLPPEEASAYLHDVFARLPGHPHILVLSEHPANEAGKSVLQAFANDNTSLVIARLGYQMDQATQLWHTRVALFVPHNTAPFFIDGVSLSEEDRRRSVPIHPGKVVNVFVTSDGTRLAILNCHDYTHADLIERLFVTKVDVVIVAAFNPAWRLYEDYAMADIHRLFCFVVLSNVANYGGSAVFAPIRQIGMRKRSSRPRGVLAAAYGLGTAYLEVPLPIEDLRHRKNFFASVSPETMRPDAASEQAAQESPERSGTFLPSEHFLKSRVRFGGCDTIDLDKLGYCGSAHEGRVHVAVAHLQQASMKQYVSSRYHLTGMPPAQLNSYINNIRGHLQLLEQKITSTAEPLHFLVFPEVFVPNQIETDLHSFAARFGTIVIAGIEYDCPITESSEIVAGQNRAIVLVPGSEGNVTRCIYRKLTRSQYDAVNSLNPDGSIRDRFAMVRGERLMRFFHPRLGTFSMLICYDFSHFGITHTVNRLPWPESDKDIAGIGNRRDLPPEILFVLSYNPDGDLYRRCAIADAHRFYQYIVMCNVASYGGSGVFAPIRSEGQSRTVFMAGQGVEAITLSTLDLDGLRAARTRTKDFDGRFMRLPGLDCYNT